MTYEFTSELINLIREQMAAEYGVTEIDPPSRKYNCHSYAWHSVSTSNSYWINSPVGYMTDPHVTLDNSMPAGSVVVYKANGTITHSAIVTASSLLHGFNAISKWGQAGVYNHVYNDVPASYLGSQSSFEFYVCDYEHDFTGNQYYNSVYHRNTCSICGYYIQCTYF